MLSNIEKRDWNMVGGPSSICTPLVILNEHRRSCHLSCFFVLILYSLVLMWFFGTLNFKSLYLHSQNTSVQGFRIALFGKEKALQFRGTNGQIIFYDMILGMTWEPCFWNPWGFLLGFPYVIPNTTLLMLAPSHPLGSEKILLGIQQLVIAAGKTADFLGWVKLQFHILCTVYSRMILIYPFWN